MKNILTSLFTSVALCAVLPLQAHAELDIVKASRGAAGPRLLEHRRRHIHADYTA